MKTYGEMTKQEQDELRAAHEAGRTLELFNDNIGEWFATHRPTFESDIAYRVADVDSKPADIARG